MLFMSCFTHETLSSHSLDPSREALLEKPFSPATPLAQIRAMLDQQNPEESDPQIGSVLLPTRARAQAPLTRRNPRVRDKRSPWNESLVFTDT